MTVTDELLDELLDGIGEQAALQLVPVAHATVLSQSPPCTATTAVPSADRLQLESQGSVDGIAGETLAGVALQSPISVASEGDIEGDGAEGGRRSSREQTRNRHLDAATAPHGHRRKGIPRRARPCASITEGPRSGSSSDNDSDNGSNSCDQDAPTPPPLACATARPPRRLSEGDNRRKQAVTPRKRQREVEGPSKSRSGGEADGGRASADAYLLREQLVQDYVVRQLQRMQDDTRQKGLSMR